MGLAEIYEGLDDALRSEITHRTVQTVSFATLAVLLFYFVLDTAGLETGPLDPDVMLLVLFVGLALGAAVFLHVFNVPYSFYLMLIVVTAPGVVVVREHILHGPAGVESPVTFVFMGVIVAALLIGGGLEVAARHLR